MSVKLLTYDVYRSGMTLFKDLADQTYQDKEHLPEYFMRKVAQSEVPAGYDAAYRLVYRVAGDPDEHVNGATIGIMGAQGGGVIQGYIVGDTPFASDWLSDVEGGEPIVPAGAFLYLILTPGLYYHTILRYDEDTDVYIKVMDARDIIFAYIVGNTPFASDWLSLTVNGSPLTPQDDKFYVILTAGDYENFIFRYDSTSTEYIMLSGGGAGGGAIFTYIVGNVPFSATWLSDAPGGAPITPQEGLLYLVLTSGAHYSALYRYDETNHVYILVGNARTVEITKADYLNLPAAKQNDGTIYFITDSASSAPTADDYVPSRATAPSNPATGMIILWKGATGGDFTISPAFYRYDGAHWQLDNLGIEGQTIQVDTMPTPTSDLMGKVLQYTGTTTANYQHNFFYECVESSGNYIWVNTKVQFGDDFQVTTMPAASADYVGKVFQYIGTTNGTYNHNYFYECIESGGSYAWANTRVQDGETIQFTSLPTASAALSGKVYQYTGTTTADYKHNYFYECVNDGGTYKWVNTNVQDGETIQFMTLPAAGASNVGKVYQYIGTTTTTFIHNWFYECVESSGNYAWVPTRVDQQDVKRISLSDFDLLSTDEKNNGTAYFIPDATLPGDFSVRTGFTPIGSIVPISGVTPPRNYLKCDGTVYNIVDYPDLAEFFEDEYGAINYFGGNGTTTFAVPKISGGLSYVIYCIAIHDVYIDSKIVDTQGILGTPGAIVTGQEMFDAVVPLAEQSGFLLDEQSVEQAVGTYIDSLGNASTVYQRSISFSVSTISVRTWANLGDLTSWNIDKCIDIIGYSVLSGNFHPISWNDGLMFFTVTYQGSSDKTLQACYNTQNNGGVTGYVTLRYTKTTT